MNIKNAREELIEDLRGVLRKVNGLKSDKALPIVGSESWRLGDKYQATGDEIVTFMFDNYKEITNKK